MRGHAHQKHSFIIGNTQHLSIQFKQKLAHWGIFRIRHSLSIHSEVYIRETPIPISIRADDSHNPHFFLRYQGM